MRGLRELGVGAVEFTRVFTTKGAKDTKFGEGGSPQRHGEHREKCRGDRPVDRISEGITAEARSTQSTIKNFLWDLRTTMARKFTRLAQTFREKL